MCDPCVCRRFVSGAVLTAEVSRLTRVASHYTVDDPKRIASIETLQECKRRKQVFEESKAAELPYYVSAIRNAICEDSALARALSEQGRADEAMLATIRVKVMKKEIREREEQMRARMEEVQAKLAALKSAEDSIRNQLAEVDEEEMEEKEEKEQKQPAEEAEVEVAAEPSVPGDAESEIRKLEEMGQVMQAQELRRIRDQTRQDVSKAREAGMTENQKKRERKKRAKLGKAAGDGDTSGEVTAATVGRALEERELPDMVKKLAMNLSQDPEVLRQLLDKGELDEELMKEVTLRGVREVAKHAPDPKSAGLLEKLVENEEGAKIDAPAGATNLEDPVAAKAALAAVKGQITVAETEEQEMLQKKEQLRLKMERKQKRFQELQRQRDERASGASPAGFKAKECLPSRMLEQDLDLD